MKKKDFVTLMMSVVGGILFALGMCMALLPEWNAMTQGVVIGAVGLVVLLVIAARPPQNGRQACHRIQRKSYCDYIVWYLFHRRIRHWNVHDHGLEHDDPWHCSGNCWHPSAVVPDSRLQGLEITKEDFS